MADIKLKCCGLGCTRDVKTDFDYAWGILGIVYCAQCKAEQGYIDGVEGKPVRPTDKHVWLVEGTSGDYDERTNWIEAVFSTESGAETFLRNKGTERVETEHGAYYLLPAEREGHTWLEERYIITDVVVQD